MYKCRPFCIFINYFFTYIHNRRASLSTEDDNLEELYLGQTAGVFTSTPNPNMHISPIDNASVVSSNQGSSIRLMEMEDELAMLRKQIAMLVVAQESNSNNKTITGKSHYKSGLCYRPY